DGTLQEAWRRFHAGEFAGAVELGLEAGPEGHVVVNKASGIHADYMEDDDDRREALYKAGIARAEQAIGEYPDDPNAHYFHAFHLGRYSQSISIAKALSQGLGGKIRKSLERTLELAPEHAEAHTALGLYHAEIIAKVGRMVGGVTYGANPDRAIEHFQRAIDLTGAPIAWIEYGNGLYLLFGDKRVDESNEAYEKAAEKTPIDAMQALDVEYAKSSLG
ncbi:MAG: hypothetical protein R3323_04990, partial [Wenzhouxiangellaceae bacterium]|nr:hypothetical protein [Wenzhouxiangellaceae bacterium]